MDLIGGTPFIFDTNIGNSSQSNSTSSVTSGSPISSLLGSDSMTRPSWLFASQSVYANQSTPTEALSSLLDPFSSPVLDTQSQKEPLSISQLTGSPYTQMTNRLGSAHRSSYSLMSPGADSSNPLGAPGTPINTSGSMSVLSTPGCQLQQQPIPPAKNAKLYKTELCRSWMEHGRCNYGERCQYAHGDVEKRPIPRHPKYKTEACQSFHQTGYCPYGPRCHFIHNEPELLSQLSSVSAALSFPTTAMRAGGPGGPAMTPGTPNLHSSSLLNRMSSLPAGYGSTGDSSPSGSSVDSGSESPIGSFSPALDLDDGGPFTIGFMNAQPLVRRQPSQQQQQQFNSVYDQKTEPMAGLLNDLMAFKFEEKWDDTTVSRLPVFAQLSANQ